MFNELTWGQLKGYNEAIHRKFNAELKQLAQAIRIGDASDEDFKKVMREL